MIRKLRIKFVVINMSIVTVLLVIILGLVMYFTELQIGLRSVRMMQELNNRPFSLITPKKYSDEISLPYLTVRLGPNGERVSQSSNYYDLSNEEFLEEITHLAISSGKRTGELDNYNLRYCFVDAPHNEYLIFSDTSSEKATLDSLLKICISLGVTGFFVFLAGSIFLSGWAVRPIREAMEQQRQFIADASHELKTPLTVLIANAQLLQSPACTRARAEKCTGAILTMSQQMKTLINELLLLAQIDSRAAGSAMESFNLSELLQNAVLPFEPLFFERGLSLSTDVRDGVCMTGCKEHIRQLIDILLDNAQKYSLSGSRTEVTMISPGKGRCLISVSNQGPALTQEQIHSLFKRFYRADESRSGTGSFGLGLSIAQAIVHEHGGSISAESKSGRNIFRIELPCGSCPESHNF